MNFLINSGFLIIILQIFFKINISKAQNPNHNQKIDIRTNHLKIDKDSITKLIKWPNNFSNLQYLDFVKIEKKCLYKDKCGDNYNKPKLLDDLLLRDCFCEDDCARFGNCCIDSSLLNKTLNLKNTQKDETNLTKNLNSVVDKKEEFECKEIYVNNSNKSVFIQVKNKCPNDFTNNFIKSKCEQFKGFSNELSGELTQNIFNQTDPYYSLPVTFKNSKVTYTNFFCALCNEKSKELKDENFKISDIDTNELVFWKMSISCFGLGKEILASSNQTLEEYLLDNLFFDIPANTWSIQITNRHGNQENLACSLKPSNPVQLQSSLNLCNPSLIDKCSPNWSNKFIQNQKIESLCSSYQSSVYHQKSKKEFKNVHCALCNYIDISELSCIPEKSWALEGRSPFIQSFNVLFDVNFATGGSNIVGKTRINKCSQDSIFDPFYRKCRNVICGFEKEFLNGQCVVKQSFFETEDSYKKVLEDLFSENRTDLNDSIDSIDTIIDDELNTQNVLQPDEEFSQSNQTYYKIGYALDESKMGKYFTEEFKNCDKIKLKNGFMELKNESIFLQQYDLILSKGNYNLSNSEVLVCVPFSPFLDKFESHYSAFAYFGLLFSIFCLTLYLALFCLVPDLRNLSGKNLSSLCLSLIIVYCCFAITPFESLYQDIHICTILALIKYYGLLSSFSWTGIIAFDVHQTIQKSLKSLTYKTGPQNGRFFIYSLICWTLPLAGITIAWMVDNGKIDNIPNEFKPNFNESKECWFKHRKSLLIFFVIPAGLITILNLYSFLITSKNLLITTKKNKLKLTSSSKNKFDFNLYIRLFILMGLTWIFGFLASYFDKIYLWYLFTIFNTLQGVFIFIAFGCKKAILKKLKNRILYLNSKIVSNKTNSISTSSRTPTTQTQLSNKIIETDLESQQSNIDRINLNNENSNKDQFFFNKKIEKNSLDSLIVNQFDTKEYLNEKIIKPNSLSVPFHNSLQFSKQSQDSATPISNSVDSQSFNFPYKESKPKNNYHSQINKWFD